MTKWAFDPEQKSGILAIEGGLTIRSVGDLKQRLVEAFSEAEMVTVDVSTAEAVDVAGIQLLCACHRYSVGRGKEMSLYVGQNAVFESFIDETGFARNFVCSHGKDSHCLWAEQK